MSNEAMREQSREAMKAFKLLYPDVLTVGIIQEDFIYRNTRVFWWKGVQYQIWLYKNPQVGEAKSEDFDITIASEWKGFGSE